MKSRLSRGNTGQNDSGVQTRSTLMALPEGQGSLERLNGKLKDGRKGCHSQRGKQ